MNYELQLTDLLWCTLLTSPIYFFFLLKRYPLETVEWQHLNRSI